ncbi:phage major capsid protein [Rhodococcus erythropolis]|uniref:phage major capsid protein n=1 Tax=Rhodococcus erythropolis TaxID=1833 RepID=UPI00141338A6|nr:phage major capsid protein [Rhodococcus erythropolis]
MLTSTAGVTSILTPDQVNALLIQPLQNLAIATRVSTVVNVGTHGLRLPSVLEDPSAGWVAEGAEIPVSESDLGEIEVVPSKLAGLVVISNELAADSSPAALQVVGDGLVRDIQTKLDTAYFGNLAAPAAKGLASITTTTINAGAAWTNTDPFAEAIAAAETKGVVITNFVANPADALLLAKVKKQTGSNEPLLGLDATAPTARTIRGVPLLVSPAVLAGTVWAIPQSRSFVAIRNDTSVTTDASAFYTSDRTAIRATMRVGFGFPQPLGIVRINITAGG